MFFFKIITVFLWLFQARSNFTGYATAAGEELLVENVEGQGRSHCWCRYFKLFMTCFHMFSISCGRILAAT